MYKYVSILVQTILLQGSVSGVHHYCNACFFLNEYRRRNCALVSPKCISDHCIYIYVYTYLWTWESIDTKICKPYSRIIKNIIGSYIYTKSLSLSLYTKYVWFFLQTLVPGWYPESHRLVWMMLDVYSIFFLNVD